MTLGQVLQQAVSAYEQGRWADVERACRSILAVRKETFEALYLLGLVASQTGRAAESAEFLASALRLNPGHADAQFNRGVALEHQGRFAEALDCYSRAVQLRPEFTHAHFNRAAALGALGRPAEALESYERAIALSPADEQAHFNRGVLLVELKRFGDALASFDRAVALRPDYARALAGRGMAQWGLGRLDEALSSVDRALSLQPGNAMAWSHRATILLDLDRSQEALASCERALALEPDTVDAHYNRGNALRALNRFQDAIVSFDRAIALEPRHALAHWNLADCLLIGGEFARGWKEYEWRWRPERPGVQRLDLRGALWSGDRRQLEGRTILLYGELGLGDTLQFCRYASEVARLGGQVLLEVQPPLVPLLRTLDAQAQVLAAGAALPEFDLHCPLMRLPMAFRSDLSSIPAEIPYLRSDPERVTALRESLGDPTRPRIGLVWCGSEGLKNDKRSMMLAEMLPLLGDDAEWFSLQKELRQIDGASVAKRTDIRWLRDECADFIGTAALVDLMDLVVTVDTSIAHLAGALGKPVWILLPHTPHDWRWFVNRADSPWYPTARLFRQSAPGDWSGVVRDVALERGAGLAGARRHVAGAGARLTSAPTGSRRRGGSPRR